MFPHPAWAVDTCNSGPPAWERLRFESTQPRSTRRWATLYMYFLNLSQYLVIFTSNNGGARPRIRRLFLANSGRPRPSTGISSQIWTNLCAWAIGQARAGCYSQAALSSNESKMLWGWTLGMSLPTAIRSPVCLIRITPWHVVWSVFEQ